MGDCTTVTACPWGMWGAYRYKTVSALVLGGAAVFGFAVIRVGGSGRACVQAARGEEGLWQGAWVTGSQGRGDTDRQERMSIVLLYGMTGRGRGCLRGVAKPKWATTCMWAANGALASFMDYCETDTAIAVRFPYVGYSVQEPQGCLLPRCKSFQRQAYGQALSPGCEHLSLGCNIQ